MNARRSLTRSWRIVLQAGGHWLERNAFVHAWSLAFYTLFSMAPIVIIAVAIAGAILGEEAAKGQIVAEMDDFLGPEAAKAVEDAVVRSRPAVAGLVPTRTGVFALLLGATTVFAQMQISLNRIWGVVSKPVRSGIVNLVKTRLLSLTIILIICFVLLVSLLLNVALVGRYLIAFYLTYTAPASTYGAAGSLVLVLLWVYYSSLILFFGAALTRARVLASGRRVVPRPTAVRVREQIVEE